MLGVLAEASRLFGDSTVVKALGPLRRRLGKLNARSSDVEIAGLAEDVAGVLTSGDVEGQVDLSMVDLLLNDRFNSVQQRFMRELRAHLEGTR
jgi:hypothetical protein